MIYTADRVKVINNSGTHFHLVVPNSTKVYKITGKRNGEPGIAFIPEMDFQEILNSNGGREILTKRLSYENVKEVVEKFGIDKKEMELTDADLSKILTGTNIKAIETLLKDAHYTVLQRIPELSVTSKVTDIRTLKLIEDACGIKIVDRADKAPVSK